MKSLFPHNLDEDNLSFWRKLVDLRSFNVHNKDLQTKLQRLIDNFMVFSVHHEFRSPWVVAKPIKRSNIAKVFALNRPDADRVLEIQDEEICSFIKAIYARREQIILRFATDERILAKKINLEFNSSEVGINIFMATFIVPALFGHFLGKSNISDFVEAVGVAFDHYSNNPGPFFETFDSSFLCWTLRQFFFSALIRRFIGEQFTVFFDFFQSYKRLQDTHYNRIQRFFSLFLKELADPLTLAPSYIRALFGRITKNFEDKNKVVLTVVIHCILTMMTDNPVQYGVVPLTTDKIPNAKEVTGAIKFYCCVVSGLPATPISKHTPPIKESEFVDKKLVENLMNVLLAPSEIDDCGQEPESVTIPFYALQSLAKFEGETKVYNLLNTHVQQSPETIIKFNFAHEKPPIETSMELKHLVILCNTNGPYFDDEFSPRQKAIYSTLKMRTLNFDQLVDEAQKTYDRILDETIEYQTKINNLENWISETQKALTASETLFVNSIAQRIADDINLDNELGKRKTAMVKDGNMFAQYLVSHIDSYSAKHPWSKPYIPFIARKMHSIMMHHFPLNYFTSMQKELSSIDQEFLSKKMILLSNLEKNSLDDQVSMIVEKKTIFASAQTAVLRACLYENPVESAKQIVNSLFTIEDLFNFQFGCPPEANQLMPLLANLFILTPAPTPLSFGKWLAHFLQPLMQIKPEWFCNEELRPLEHYFQFNAWMNEMLHQITKPVTA